MVCERGSHRVSREKTTATEDRGRAWDRPVTPFGGLGWDAGHSLGRLGAPGEKFPESKRLGQESCAAVMNWFDRPRTKSRKSARRH